MSRRQKMFAVLPTLLTLGNAACGFGSITFAAKVGPEPTEGFDPLFIAALLIFFAMLLVSASVWPLYLRCKYRGLMLVGLRTIIPEPSTIVSAALGSVGPLDWRRKQGQLPHVWTLLYKH